VTCMGQTRNAPAFVARWLKRKNAFGESRHRCYTQTFFLIKINFHCLRGD
jgi:hypothetical protein